MNPASFTKCFNRFSAFLFKNVKLQKKKKNVYISHNLYEDCLIFFMIEFSL